MEMSFCLYVLHMHYVSTASYYTLAEGPGVAREFFFWIFASLCYSRDTLGFPLKMSVHSVQYLEYMRAWLYSVS